MIDNLFGTPNGTMSSIMGVVSKLRDIPNDEKGHIVFSLTPNGPLLVAGPHTGGIIVLETNDYQTSAGKEIAESIEANYGIHAEYMALSIERINWNILSSGKTTSEEAYHYIIQSDENGILSRNINKPQKSQFGVSVEKTHVPRDAKMTQNMIDTSAKAFLSGAGNATFFLDGVEVGIQDAIYRDDEYLPAIITHSIIEWAPVEKTTGKGFSICLKEDDIALFGYKIAAIYCENPFFLSLAISETARRLRKENEIDIGLSVRKLRKWLSDRGYNTQNIDNMIIDDVI